jgi:hypothetical protein
MTSVMLEQRPLQECWGSAQRWLTSISAAMASTLSGNLKGRLQASWCGQASGLVL